MCKTLVFFTRIKVEFYENENSIRERLNKIFIKNQRSSKNLRLILFEYHYKYFLLRFTNTHQQNCTQTALMFSIRYSGSPRPGTCSKLHWMCN